MAFDPNLDVKKFEEAIEFERTKITVSVHSYNEGIPKLQISRENKNADEQYNFAKLGRMVKEEAEKVLPLITQAIEKM
jgi:hypothetical protein